MDNKPQSATTVGELESFPFKSFQEFVEAWRKGTAIFNLDTMDAHNLAFWAGSFLMLVISICEWSLVLVPIGFVIYVMVNRMWLLLLSLPLFIVAPFAFNQDTPKIVRRGLLLLTLLALLWSIEAPQTNVTILTIALFAIWLAQKVIHDVSLNALTNASTKNEGLLCDLWQRNAMSITFRNGNQYSVLYKVENGNKIYYKKEFEFLDKQLPERPKHSYLP